MTPTLAGRYRCGLCLTRTYATEAEADACCATAKQIAADPFLMTDDERRIAMLETELKQARKRVADATNSARLWKSDSDAFRARAEKAERALAACVEALNGLRDSNDYPGGRDGFFHDCVAGDCAKCVTDKAALSLAAEAGAK